jgi:hypothetical protein
LITDSVSGKIGFIIPLIVFCIPFDFWFVSLAGFKIDLGRLNIAAKTITQIGILRENNIKELK